MSSKAGDGPGMGWRARSHREQVQQMQQAAKGGRKAMFSSRACEVCGRSGVRGQARRMNSKVRQQVVAAKEGPTRWRRLGQQGGREG